MGKNGDEIEGKFVVHSGTIPDGAERIRVVQGYLRKKKGSNAERRVRSWKTQDGKVEYTYGVKSPTSEKAKRKEDEVEINLFVYLLLLIFLRDWGCSIIRKIRHVYPANDRMWEHDVYEGKLSGLQTVEVEVDSVEELTGIETPSNLNCTNVTGNKSYSNRSLAEHGIPKS